MTPLERTSAGSGRMMVAVAAFVVLLLLSSMLPPIGIESATLGREQPAIYVTGHRVVLATEGRMARERAQMLAVAGGLSLPDANIETGTHADERHGADADLVRAYFAEIATRNPDTFWNQPDCKDGRRRYIGRYPDGRWAIWVLERIAPYEWAERTAFFSDQGYAHYVRDDCGRGGYWGHAYGG